MIVETRGMGENAVGDTALRDSPANPPIAEATGDFVRLGDGTKQMKQGTKKRSDHSELLAFFSDVSLAARGFRPMISAKDAGQLKRAIGTAIMGREKLEQLMLYYLADKKYKGLEPSVATMLSAGVLNQLRNAALNRPQFFKELDQYAARYVRRVAVEVRQDAEEETPTKLADLIAKLAARMAIPQEKKKVERQNPTRGPDKPRVGTLFG